MAGLLFPSPPARAPRRACSQAKVNLSSGVSLWQLFSMSTSLRSRRLEVVGTRKNGGARIPPVSPSRATVLSFAHYRPNACYSGLMSTFRLAVGHPCLMILCQVLMIVSCFRCLSFKTALLLNEIKTIAQIDFLVSRGTG